MLTRHERLRCAFLISCFRDCFLHETNIFLFQNKRPLKGPT